MWPVPGARRPTAAILQYGYQRSPTHVHNGIDIPAPEGTPVVAVRAGKVTHALAAWEPGFSGYGGHVVIASGGEWDLYAHLASVSVGRGELVSEGQQIGTVGRTSYTAADHTALLNTGPHLHYERSPRPYPQESTNPRLDPVPLLTERPMQSRQDLSDLFTALRAAAVDRAGKPRPGVSQSTADAVLEIAERARVYLDTAPPLIYRPTWDQWLNEYRRGRELLGAAGAGLTEIATPLSTTLERAIGGVGVAAAVALALVLLSRGRGN